MTKLSRAGTGRLAGLLALFCWAYASWLVLTWTVTAEQLVCGAVVSLLLALLLSPLLGTVVRPWALLTPGRALAAIRLVLVCLAKIVLANLRLAGRIWSPTRPLATGMVVVDTTMTSDAGLAGVGLLSSLIVDNQLVDLDRGRGELQYHAVAVPGPDVDRAAVVTGGTEPLVRALLRDRP
ncbi:MAG TPA: Na+/H+ antiporter subunit E [Jatrophihabitans sp.]|nr:Na+/H+ antiporter subunit E [Jatrophihabitans sp.]